MKSSPANCFVVYATSGFISHSLDNVHDDDTSMILSIPSNDLIKEFYQETLETLLAGEWHKEWKWNFTAPKLVDRTSLKDKESILVIYSYHYAIAIPMTLPLRTADASDVSFSGDLNDLSKTCTLHWKQIEHYRNVFQSFEQYLKSFIIATRLGFPLSRHVWYQFQFPVMTEQRHEFLGYLKKMMPNSLSHFPFPFPSFNELESSPMDLSSCSSLLKKSFVLIEHLERDTMRILNKLETPTGSSKLMNSVHALLSLHRQDYFHDLEEFYEQLNELYKKCASEQERLEHLQNSWFDSYSHWTEWQWLLNGIRFVEEKEHFMHWIENVFKVWHENDSSKEEAAYKEWQHHFHSHSCPDWMQIYFKDEMKSLKTFHDASSQTESYSDEQTWLAMHQAFARLAQIQTSRTRLRSDNNLMTPPTLYDAWFHPFNTEISTRTLP